MWCLVWLPCLAWCFTPSLLMSDSFAILLCPLPPRIRRPQAEKDLARSLHVSRQGCGMLNGDVNVAEVTLERIPLVDGVGAGGMEDQVDGANCLAHAMRDRKSCLHDGRVEIGLALTSARP